MAESTRRGKARKERIAVAVVTSSRSDWCHLAWPLRDMESHPDLAPRLIVTGAHLSPDFGRTIDTIEADGFQVAERVECPLSSDTDTAMARTIGHMTAAFAELLDRLRPDVLLLSADRHEILAPAMAALALRVPIAHIEGGEWTAGAIDNAVRNTLTMLAHLHFTTSRQAACRVVAMGEEPWRVHRVGAPSLDHIHRGTLLDHAGVEARLGFEMRRPPIVAAYHPVTLQDDPTDGVEALLAALATLDEPVVFCLPNADAGGRALARRARAFCDGRENARLFVNLEPILYWSLLRQAAVLVGNSSSGLMETPSLGVPAVNVGPRQAGRQRAANVIDVEPDADDIRAALDRARSDAFRAGLQGLANPYGDGRAGTRIARLLADLPSRERLLHKTDTLARRVEPPG